MDSDLIQEDFVWMPKYQGYLVQKYLNLYFRMTGQQPEADRWPVRMEWSQSVDLDQTADPWSVKMRDIFPVLSVYTPEENEYVWPGEQVDLKEGTPAHYKVWHMFWIQDLLQLRDGA